MRKALTMLEIVFAVIVIGVLSAIAVPKLLGTKSDAEIVKLKKQVRDINTSIQAYSKQRMIITGNMDEEESYPKSLNEGSVLFGKVLSGADTLKWKQDTNNKQVEDFLYTYEIKGYGKFWFAYILPDCSGVGVNCRGKTPGSKATENVVKHVTYWYFPKGKPGHNVELHDKFPVGSFKCYKFEDSHKKMDNSVCDKLFS